METREEFVAGLRAMADHFEDHPDQDLPYVGNSKFYIWPDSKDEFTEQVRALGSCDKGSDDNYVNASKQFGPFTVQVTANHSAVCERVVKGTHMVTKKVYPNVEPVETLVEEEIVEWVCPPSFLKETV
jgi:hypothetical protein